MSLFDQIKVSEGRNSYHYKFTICSFDGCRSETIEGIYKEHTADWVRLRLQSGNREHKDVYIPLHAVCKMEEIFSAE